jgi:hypothetical protein
LESQYGDQAFAIFRPRAAVFVPATVGGVPDPHFETLQSTLRVSVAEGLVTAIALNRLGVVFRKARASAAVQPEPEGGVTVSSFKESSR